MTPYRSYTDTDALPQQMLPRDHIDMSKSVWQGDSKINPRNLDSYKEECSIIDRFGTTFLLISLHILKLTYENAGGEI